MSKYTVITQTSKDYKKGATNASVFIQLMSQGGKSRTRWVKLDNCFRNNFKAGRKDTFQIKSDDVGLPQIIGLKIDKTHDTDGWLCDYVIIKHQSLGEVFFSVYDVIMDEITVRTGDASLPQHDTDQFIQDIRRIELERNKHMYQWHSLPGEQDLGWDLPRYVNVEGYDDLPLLLLANDVRQEEFLCKRNVAKYNTLAEAVKGKLVNNTMKKFSDFYDVYNHPSLPNEKPAFHKIWNTDEEFGRQMINGVNPTVIQLCTKLPEEFKAAEAEIFGGNTASNKFLEEKRLYYISYRGKFTGLKRNKSKSGQQLYCCESICLLQVRDDKKLVPVAIQLEENGCVFTPHDSELDWLLAKQYFRNSDANAHEFQSHLLRTHIAMEPFAIGMFRSFSRSHPIYKLLRPHLQTVSAINTLGREMLIGAAALANFSLSLNGGDATKASFRAVTFDDMIIPNLLKKNGTDDPDALPYYHYRDDAKDLWNIIGKFVSNTLQIFYKCDKDIIDDPELQEFIRTVAEDGIGWAGIYGTKGFPTTLKTRPELEQYIIMIIFTSSVQHAASNFGQFEIYKFIPNAPVGMRLPPHKKGEASMKRIMDSLPDPIMASLQVTVSNTLSSFSPNEIYLGDYPMKLFTEKQVLDVQKEFKNDLEQLSVKIKSRNAELAKMSMLPYIHLLPERIPNSIAV